MASQNLQKQIEGFINTQVVSRGLDERTAIAYRMDLEQFHSWMELKIKEKFVTLANAVFFMGENADGEEIR